MSPILHATRPLPYTLGPRPYTLGVRQRFQFRWLILIQEATYVNELVLFQTLSRVEQQWENAAERTVIGAWTPSGLSPELVVLTQELHMLLPKPFLAEMRRIERFASGLWTVHGVVTLRLSQFGPLRVQF